MRFIFVISFKTSHIFREGNAVADIISKAVINSNSKWSSNLSDICYSAHLDDCWGLCSSFLLLGYGISHFLLVAKSCYVIFFMVFCSPSIVFPVGGFPHWGFYSNRYSIAFDENWIVIPFYFNLIHA